MILVLLGTQNNNFSRLLEKIDKCIDKKIINEKVVVQAGNTKYKSKNMDIFDFTSADELNKITTKADLIITHGGVGSIISSIKLGKKVIAVPRQKKYNEHVNDHQVQIVKTLEKGGYIIGVYNIDELEEQLLNISEFVPKEYKNENNSVADIVKEFIDNN